MSRWTATGPSLAGCHEIAEAIAAEFIRRGGEDIQVWDTEYLIDAKSHDAVDYVTEALSLSGVELTEE